MQTLKITAKNNDSDPDEVLTYDEVWQALEPLGLSDIDVEIIDE